MEDFQGWGTLIGINLHYQLVQAYRGGSQMEHRQACECICCGRECPECLDAECDTQEPEGFATRIVQEIPLSEVGQRKFGAVAKHLKGLD